ncbi:MAG: ribosome small subunit-dependent GTPase A [Flavobacteriales bacterium]
MKKGIVYRSTGSWYTVQSQGSFYECRIKGKLRLKDIKSTNPVAVGDKVHFEVDSNTSLLEGNITYIEERQNYIVRKSVNLSKQTQIIASNIDQVFLLVTLNNPPTFPAFIDRFLVTAEAYHIPAIVLFNKIDIYSEVDLNEINHLQMIYKKIGYSTYMISATKGDGVQKIKELMQDKVSMFSGHSGVGKSTLVNAISPSLNLKTSAISKQHKQGMHTTTFAEMFALSKGIKIIDTPGIKGFGVVDMLPEEIGNYFPEFYQRKGNCKFHNCIHLNEPECAIIKAVEKGVIALSRYTSYTQMMEEDSTYRN